MSSSDHNQSQKPIACRNMDHSTAALSQAIKGNFRLLWDLIFSDIFGHISRHFFTKYNTANASIDKLSTRITDFFACITDTVIAKDFLRYTGLRVILNLLALISIVFALLHMTLQITLSAFITSIIGVFNLSQLMIQNIGIELLLLRLIPNILSTITSIIPVFISQAARRQTSRNVRRIASNFYALGLCLWHSPSIVAGSITLSLDYTKEKDPDTFTVSKETKYWTNINVYLKVASANLKETKSYILDNLQFLIMTPFLLVTTWIHSCLLLTRALTRIALSPISVLAVHIQPILWGTTTGPASYQPLSPILQPTTPPDAKVAKNP